MLKRALEQLDYFAVINQVSEFCASDEAKASFREKLPMINTREIEETKTLSKEWTSLLHEAEAQPQRTAIFFRHEIKPALRLLQVEGTTLEQEQINYLLQFCSSVLAAKNLLSSAKAGKLKIPNLQALADTIPFKEIACAQEEILKVLDSNGNLKELPVLVSIKARIAELQAQVEAALKRYTSDPAFSDALCSKVPALKGERQLLAVKANRKSAIQGIVFDVSSSGQTLFIEPEEAVQKNNELKKAKAHLALETRKIFTQLTFRLSSFCAAFFNTLSVMIKLDETCAAAKWGIKHKCVFARRASSSGEDANQEMLPHASSSGEAADQKDRPCDSSSGEAENQEVLRRDSSSGEAADQEVPPRTSSSGEDANQEDFRRASSSTQDANQEVLPRASSSAGNADQEVLRRASSSAQAADPKELRRDSSSGEAANHEVLRRASSSAGGTRQEEIRLIKARHPLLEEKAEREGSSSSVVPIDICFPKDAQVLLITGANAGGKTVSIKTFALLSLLNQTALPIPADEETVLPVFKKIFVDIGDEQSIQSSLSTFSSSMKNIAQAVREADESSLVLLDELSSGTDPQEGGALAMAILDELIKKKALVLATTHNSALKYYAFTHPFCANASVLFDSETLCPSYKLTIGIPDSSHALSIAAKSGLPDSLLAQARAYLTSEQSDVNQLIADLTLKNKQVSLLQNQAEEKLKIIKEQELKQDQRSIELRDLELKIKERERQKESEFIRQARSRLENLVRVIREGEITKEKTSAVKQFVSELTESSSKSKKELLNAQEELQNQKDLLITKAASSFVSPNGIKITNSSPHTSQSKKGKRKRREDTKEAFAKAKIMYTKEEAARLSFSSTENRPPHEFKEGGQIIWKSTGSKGTLLKKEKNSSWSVQLGSLRATLKESEMLLLSPSPLLPSSTSAQKDLPSADFNTPSPKKEEELILPSPRFELYLLGMRAQQAVKVLERQIDLCAAHDFKSFSVIHGKGEGILQNAVQEYLSLCPQIKEYRFAPPQDGGSGKTYVTLK